MRVLILAGGFATRLWPLTKERPKPLLPIAGKPIIDHIVAKIPPETKIYLTTNMRFARDFEHWKSGVKRDVELIIEPTHEESQKLGAVGAINYAIELKEIDERLLVIGGDNMLGFDLGDFIQKYTGKPLIAVYDIKNLQEAKKYGCVSLKNGKIVKFEEKPTNPTSSLISTACYLFPSTVFHHITNFCSKGVADRPGDFIKYLIKKEDVHAFEFTGKWFDIGCVESYLDAHRAMPGIFSQKKLINTRTKGSIYVGENSLIENSKIHDSIIFDNVKIHNSEISNCIIDSGSIVKNVKLENELIESGSEIAG